MLSATAIRQGRPEVSLSDQKIATIYYHSNQVRFPGSGARGACILPSYVVFQIPSLWGIITCLEVLGGGQGPPAWIVVLGINGGALGLAGTGRRP